MSCDVELNELSWADVIERAMVVSRQIPPGSFMYPVPRGGMFAALAIASADGQRQSHTIVERPSEATVYVDDIVDSGETRRLYCDKCDKPFFALVDKPAEGIIGWIVFPWERMSGEVGGPEENVRRLIEFIGDDPKREGLRETPQRVIRSYSELFSGYSQDASQVLKVFSDDSCNEMVVVKDIEIYSMCEHHMLPFFGRCHMAYIPDGRVVGVSKLVRLVEIFARRLQIQERLCEQVTAALDEYLKPKGSACVIEAVHLCMTCRGVQKQHSKMITSSLTGAFRESVGRAEFFSIVQHGREQ